MRWSLLRGFPSGSVFSSNSLNDLYVMNNQQKAKRAIMAKKNPNFKRPTRITTNNQWHDKRIRDDIHKAHLASDLIKERERQKQLVKEERWKREGTLGERTERYIREGDSEHDAYRQAKWTLIINSFIAYILRTNHD